MPSAKHNSAVKKIKDFFEEKGYRCKEQVSVIRNKKNPIDNETGRIDICCKQGDSLFCAEVESGAQRQAVLNQRDIEEMGRQSKQKRIRFRSCQVSDDEDFNEVCFRK